MRTFWAQPLRRQLLLANILLIVGPVLALAIWLSLATLRDERDDLKEQAEIVASTTASYINRDITYLDSIAQLLAADPVVRDFDEARATEKLKNVIYGRPSVMAIVVTRGGEVVIRALRDAEDVPSPDWNPDPVSGPSRRSQPVSEDPSKPARFVIFGYPVAGKDGRPAGTLSLFIDLNRLHDALTDSSLPHHSIVIVTDDVGRVLAQNVGNDENGVRLLYGDAASNRQGDAAASLKGSDGLKRLHVRTSAAAGPWQVNVGVPEKVAVRAAEEVWWRTAAVLVIALIGCVVGAWFLSRRLGGSVSHLDAAAQRIASGDFSPLPIKPMRSAEFADLQSAFNGMLQQFNTTRTALDSQMAEERRIRQELESLQGQVIRQERLAAVGQLVSGVAHEINNPLQAILGFAELLQMQRDVPDPVKADLKIIQKESARACAIIRNLALFARQQPGEAAPVMMTDVIRSIAELRQRRLESEDIELHIQDGAVHAVKAVLTELQQVVLNFVVNAEQSIIASGRLPGRITIRSYDRGGRVVLEVEDTGPGISAENQAKLFQPFFTTKPVGQGTGLGLSISYGIIDSLGGGIGYRTAPAGGAVFYFDLPATADVPEPIAHV